tara:strand:+ start:224 stop:964 length:741 start_codon:yes stop_codon:yes gene_type:complete
MTYKIIIPARFGSSRLPGKPLTIIGDKPMIQHVWNRASESGANRIIVATDDHRIQKVCNDFGAECLMTQKDHRSGSDRIVEVCEKLDFNNDDIIVNLQGDEPFMSPVLIDELVANKKKFPSVGVATMCKIIEDISMFSNPSVVKVEFHDNGIAKFFRRVHEPIESHNGALGYKHLGIYAYSVAILKQFIKWPVAPLEKKESLEQLRFLHNSIDIHVGVTKHSTGLGIDTEEDLMAAKDFVNNITHE